jgi:hypothetical protein
MHIIDQFLRLKNISSSSSEDENYCRFNDVNSSSETLNVLKEFHQYVVSNLLGELDVLDELHITIDLLSEYNNENSKFNIRLTKKCVYFFTEEGFKRFLLSTNSILNDHIRLWFQEKTFKSNTIWLTSFNEVSLTNRSSEDIISPFKYSKQILNNTNTVFPINLRDWITSKNYLEISCVSWRVISTRKILPFLGNEFLIETDILSLTFKGDRSKKVDVQLTNEEYILGICFSIHDIFSWIFIAAKDADTRHTIYAQQLALILDDENQYDMSTFCRKIDLAFTNSILAYNYHLSNSSKELHKNLVDLNKNLFDFQNKIRQNTSDLLTTLWRDFATVLGLIILNFSIKKPDILKEYFQWFGIALSIYICVSYSISSLLGFWYYYGVKKQIEDWRVKLYSYLSDQDFQKYARSQLINSFTKFKAIFFVILACYVALLLLISCLIAIDKITFF